MYSTIFSLDSKSFEASNCVLYPFEPHNLAQGLAHTMCMKQNGKDLYIYAIAVVHSDVILVGEVP